MWSRPPGAPTDRKLSTRLLVAVGCSAALLASDAMAGAGQPDDLPVDPDAVEVYLLTYDPGDDVQTLWGHVALRVRDDRAGTDLVFDWGLADTGNPLSFIARFLKDRPTYHLSVQAYGEMVRDYTAQSRAFRQERLWLDRRENARLVRRLVWNARPEHRPYRYDLFGRNCATRIRDLLNEAVAGRIADRLGAIPGSGTRRDHVRSTLRHWPLTALGLDIVLNAEVDRPLSAWEELFLPTTLRERLRVVPASADTEAPAGSLLSESGRLEASPSRPRSGRSEYYLVASGLAPLAIAGLARTTRPAPRRSSLRIVGAGVFAFGCLSALLGILMALAWIVSRHTVLHHNANLWLFWPLDWVVAAFGWSLLMKGEPWPSASRRVRWLRGLVRAHLIAAGGFVAVWVAGLIEQTITPVIVGFVPLAGLMYGSVWLALPGVPGRRAELSRGPAVAMPAGVRS